ncbi:MAG: hypothetical protein JXA96_05110, partial [Sedimentisphaerales bacterium]|nr:hypothetical protein [Sedimentisphaerales bacterium]
MSNFLVQTSWAQQENNSFEELLKDVILESSMPISGVFDFYIPSTGWNPPVPGFVPINGLNDANAVPFLIDVMENGPDWADEDLPEGKGDMYRYVARCYASLCLGTTKDYRAFEPLVEIMNNTAIEQYHYEINVVRQVTYNLRSHAAFALGYLDDYNAVEPLMEIMEQDGFIECIYSLVRLRAAEAAPSIITIASEHELFNIDIHLGLEYILRVNFKIYSEGDVYGIEEFPEVEKKPYKEIHRTLWQHWLKVGNKYAKDKFEEYYPQWKTALEEKPDAVSRHEVLLERMTKGGVAAIPYIIKKIEQGDADLVQAISNLTGEHQLINFSASQCLQWWNENKQKWLIFTPIPETLKVPSDYPNIQAAIDDANDGDIVLVAPGTYTGEGNRDIDFMGKAITVKSEYGPESCIIQCGG